MRRLFATALTLVVAVSLVLTGTACTCAVNAAHASEPPAKASAPAGGQDSSGHDCCDDSEDGDRDADDECCDGMDCAVSARQPASAGSPIADLTQRAPTADLPEAPSTLHDIPAAWTLDLLDNVEPTHPPLPAAGDSPERPTDTPRYLAFQVLRL